MSAKTHGGSVLMLCPSFSSYSCIRFAEIADKVTLEFNDEREDFGLEQVIAISNDQNPQEEEQDKEVETESDEEFEFSFVCKDHETVTISADEIFFNGQIRPIFPISSQQEPSSSRKSLGQFLFLDLQSKDETLESSVSTDCISRPKEAALPEKCKKSNSTGTSKRWRLRDLITRSNSDSKESILFLGTEKKTIERRSADIGKQITTKRRPSERVKSAHEIHYMRARALKEADRRQTFLPYKKDLLGFFVNVNGLSRNIHPF